MRKIFATSLKLSERHANDIRIERAHRTGGDNQSGKPKTVVVKFESYKDRDTVLRAARKEKRAGRICQRRPVTPRDGTETGTHAEAARGETTRKVCLSVVRQARGAGSRRTYVVSHNKTNYVTLIHVYEP